jgi:hypothetical protein
LTRGGSLGITSVHDSFWGVATYVSKGKNYPRGVATYVSKGKNYPVGRAHMYPKEKIILGGSLLALTIGGSFGKQGPVRNKKEMSVVYAVKKSQ